MSGAILLLPLYAFMAFPVTKIQEQGFGILYSFTGNRTGDSGSTDTIYAW
jgi:hypothetical protein